MIRKKVIEQQAPPKESGVKPVHFDVIPVLSPYRGIDEGHAKEIPRTGEARIMDDKNNDSEGGSSEKLLGAIIAQHLSCLSMVEGSPAPGIVKKDETGYPARERLSEASLIVVLISCLMCRSDHNIH